jgi:hypothetical protein
MATEVNRLHKSPISDLIRKKILDETGVKPALKRLVGLGADREILMMCLEELAFQCEREKLNRKRSPTKPKDSKPFYSRPDFIAQLNKVARNIELANNLSGVALAITSPGNLEMTLYRRLPTLLRSYADHLKESRKVRRIMMTPPKGVNIRPTTRPKVFLIETIRTSTGSLCLEEISTLVAAAYYAVGRLKEKGFDARTLKQAWKRNPSLRDLLFPPPFHGSARSPSSR